MGKSTKPKKEMSFISIIWMCIIDVLRNLLKSDGSSDKESKGWPEESSENEISSFEIAYELHPEVFKGDKNLWPIVNEEYEKQYKFDWRDPKEMSQKEKKEEIEVLKKILKREDELDEIHKAIKEEIKRREELYNGFKNLFEPAVYTENEEGRQEKMGYELENNFYIGDPPMNYREDKDFIQCMGFVFEQECRRKKDGTLDDGYVWDKDDPGGETKYGISKNSYPEVDIKLLTLDGACDIFYRDYWPIASSLEFPLNVCVFDCAVNQGVKRAAKFLIQSNKDWKEFLVIRKAHYVRLYDGPFKNNPKRSVFFKSWIRRIQNVKKFIEVENAKN